MKLVLFSIFFVFLFVSCSSGSNSKTDEVQAENDIVVSEADNVVIEIDSIIKSEPDEVIIDYDEEGPDNDGWIVSSWKTVSTGYEHTCGIKTDDTLYCWGSNWDGQLGDGTTVAKFTPIKIGTDTWTDIQVGTWHTCGIKATDSKLYCWGTNSDGMVGDGSGENKHIPTKIGDDTWIKISAGHYYTCGIKTDGKLFCWGANEAGQLGDGTSGETSCPDQTPSYDCETKPTPTKIGDDTWTDVKAGVQHTCGIKTDGFLYCWGVNNNGRIGDGTKINRLIPTKIGYDIWANITTGGFHSCGIKKDNTLYCWGDGYSGQLGDGSTYFSLIPEKLNDRWTNIEAGYEHSCGIKVNDSKLYCWGDNQYGALGNGKPGEDVSNCSTKIGDDTWVKISTGWKYTCGINSDNKLYCWGYNGDGVLGDGTETYFDTSGKVNGDDNNKSIPTLVREP